jgi:hypothetical protein
VNWRHRKRESRLIFLDTTFHVRAIAMRYAGMRVVDDSSWYRSEFGGSDNVGGVPLILSRQCVKVVYLPEWLAILCCALFVASPFDCRAWLPRA